MEDFAEYILNEENLYSKYEIIYYLFKKEKIYFDKSVIFKTELARMFIDYMKIDVDRNLILTAVLLCNCKKTNNPQKYEILKTYAKDGAIYLKKLGFDNRFCNICEGINRYTIKNENREKESDILELVDQFGGMLLDRPERTGFSADAAAVLLRDRNLKDKDNRYLKLFEDFVQEINEVKMDGRIKISPFRKLYKIYNESKNEKDLMNKIIKDFSQKVDRAVMLKRNNISTDIFDLSKYSSCAMFSEETMKKIIKQLELREE